MSFRRRHRWLRRLALGLALASAVSAAVVPVAAAKRDDGPGTAVYVTGRGLQAPAADVAATRPDDLASRFSHSDVPSQPVLASSGTWTFERGDALVIAIGSFVLVLGLGFALGYLRRPRLAGF